MKISLKSLLPIALVMVFSAPVFSAVIEETGYITKVKMFTKNFSTYNSPNDIGLVIFYMDELSGACTSGEKRIAISTDHPLYDSVLSMALSAKISNSKVKVMHLSTCSSRSNAWDFAAIEIL